MAKAVLDVQGVPVRRLQLQAAAADRRKAALPLGASSLKGNRWTYPPDEVVVQVLQHQFGEDLELTPMCQNWFDARIQWRHTLTDLQLLDDAKVNVPWNDRLHSYQRVMVQFGASARRFINGDDRGLGKTLEALSVAETLESQRILVVCPGYLKLNWQRELAFWTTHPGYITRGERSQRTKTISEVCNVAGPSGPKYLVVNYEMLREKVATGGYPELIAYPWDMLIVDEAHRLKGRNSQWVPGIKAICNRGAAIQLLTGNPIDKSPEDIWQLLNFIDPMKFSSYWAFVEYFCNVVDAFFGKEIQGVNPKRMAQLQYTLQPYVLRRTKQEVAEKFGIKLADRVQHEIYVELEGTQKSFYQRLEKQMVIELENGDLELVPQLTAKHLRLQQAIANPAILGGKNCSIVEDTCVQLLHDVMSTYDKCIVATWFVPAADLMQARIEALGTYKVFRVRSDQKDVVRDSVVQAFKGCKDPAILVGTIQAMGEGLNIDECDVEILCDQAWTPTPNEQFMDRIHRVTSTRPKHYYRIIVANTVSEDKATLVATRAEARDEIWSMRQAALKMIARVKSTE